MLTIHHLGKSQSERILWLCEELGLDYELVHHVRDPVTGLAPPSLVALHPMGTAPVIEDGEIVLAESGAIMEYIIGKHGGGRLTHAPTHPDYAQYVFWWHYANGNFQPAMGRNMVMNRLNLPADNPIAARIRSRLLDAFTMMETRLGNTPFLAGESLTAADIMMVFSLTTMRYFFPFDLAPYPNVRAYLQRVAARPTYQRAMQKGDPGMKLLLD
ncbi:glutathione S-transferase family protein [Variovorax sp. PAMC28562]|uniref:glutathione S-transferase family protein n=1 Tax=Variovorax sp. PAMC28562 TaxID=2762323 RepID=UPI00164D0245|nr:glutathione S-transferase family protein [Variovorax sp. PAMC28562]QNK72948.1 glutathione S-transferase family protein [Variovorax sp. PAMC28562]